MPNNLFAGVGSPAEETESNESNHMDTNEIYDPSNDSCQEDEETLELYKLRIMRSNSSS